MREIKALIAQMGKGLYITDSSSTILNDFAMFKSVAFTHQASKHYIDIQREDSGQSENSKCYDGYEQDAVIVQPLETTPKLDAEDS